MFMETLGQTMSLFLQIQVRDREAHPPFVPQPTFRSLILTGVVQKGLHMYPFGMNHTDICWPEGASDGLPLMKEHDKYFLENLFWNLRNCVSTQKKKRKTLKTHLPTGTGYKAIPTKSKWTWSKQQSPWLHSSTSSSPFAHHGKLTVKPSGVSTKSLLNTSALSSGKQSEKPKRLHPVFFFWHALLVLVSFRVFTFQLTPLLLNEVDKSIRVSLCRESSWWHLLVDAVDDRQEDGECLFDEGVWYAIRFS